MSPTIPSWPFVTTTITLAIIFISLRAKKRSKTPYPPGPRPRFFVGNLFDIPASHPWKIYREWGKIYGDLIHFEVIGQHTVVVNSRELADRMFEKRSRVYSDRPLIPMLDLTGWMKLNTGLMRYGSDWRIHRRLYKEGFRATLVPNYQDVLSSKAEQFVSSLRQNPDSFVNHIRTYSAATIIATVYGYDIAPSNDRFVDLAEQSVGTLSDAVHPSAFVVNVLPFLRHLPLAFPVFKFQRIARRTRGMLNEMRTVPYEFVKNNVATGKGKFSFLAKLLEDHTVNGGDKHQKDIIKDVVTTAYAGMPVFLNCFIPMTPTNVLSRCRYCAWQQNKSVLKLKLNLIFIVQTVSALVTFVLAMALHPEIQKRAQNELDVVVGKGRLPTYVDRFGLPYVEAIFREALRWSPVLPLGVFHASFVDDIIDGHFIPKGE
ncbi:hypothetical protein E1B28_002328 [Marasmius oreades]|uniref:Cytochrome P450 n=1 Tax=Marasmius oreades TaxID=181124 RepID=A0A9P7RNV8_9AGAR|nr:uncharacterized protein E1B28_002328 [Marasmius oreades]KAG7086368.1 hypothetical protein E1B28_002328 [Marasmius oreades]